MGFYWLNWLGWQHWSNPVALWWGFLLTVSAVNIALLFGLRAGYQRNPFGGAGTAFAFEPLALLASAYVFGCAFRSVLPRADVQRICLFDTWLSSVLIGRSVATLAELCFALQWAIVIYELGRITRSDTAKNIAVIVVGLIVLAEGCSWYAVVSTDFLGNVIENSLWTVAFILVGIALARLFVSYRGKAQIAIGAAIAGIGGYVVFMSTIDVPMYMTRWDRQVETGHATLGLFAGLHDLATRWVVTHSYREWHNEILWMSLYFSVAVWASLALGGFGLIRHLVPRYRLRRPFLKVVRRPVPVPVRTK